MSRQTNESLERDFKIYELRQQGASLKDIAAQHNITIGRVCQICSRQKERIAKIDEGNPNVA